MQTSHEQVREACGRGLSRGCFALPAGSAFPSRCLLCVCPCVGAGSARGRNSSSHPSTAVCCAVLCLCLALWELSNSLTLGEDGLQSCSLEWAPNVAHWRNDTPTFSMWPHEAPALLNPPLLPISIGLCGQLLQPDGLPVPPEAVWQAACRGRQARVQLPTLRQEVQIQGWPRLSRAVRTHGLGEPPGRLRSPRSGAIPPRGGLQSCRAREQDRAGQGRCRRRASVVFSPKSSCTCVVPCSVGGGTGFTLLHPSKNDVCGSGRQHSLSPVPTGLCCSPPHIHALQGKKPRPQAAPSQAPAACQCWGGRICPWGASLSVPLIPADSVSDTNHSLALINGFIHVGAWRDTVYGCCWAGVLPLLPYSCAEAQSKTGNTQPKSQHPHPRARELCCSFVMPFLTLSLLQPPEEPEVKPEPGPVEDFERTPSGRIRRTSAQVAVFHLQEIAEDELARDWTKRRMKDDLVPETKRVSSLQFSIWFCTNCTQRSQDSSLAPTVHGDSRIPAWLQLVEGSHVSLAVP